MHTAAVTSTYTSSESNTTTTNNNNSDDDDDSSQSSVQFGDAGSGDHNNHDDITIATDSTTTNNCHNNTTHDIISCSIHTTTMTATHQSTIKLSVDSEHPEAVVSSRAPHAAQNTSSTPENAQTPSAPWMQPTTGFSLPRTPSLAWRPYRNWSPIPDLIARSTMLGPS